MDINKSFGKLLQDNSLEYALKAFNHNGVDYWHPTASDYKMVGYLPIVKVHPSEPAPSGYHYADDGWEVVNEEIHNKWKLVQDPPAPPRQFSKLKVVEVLKDNNLFDTVKQWVIDNDLYDQYLAAQVFAEDNAYFARGVQTLKTVLQLTDEQIKEMLESCIAEI